MEDITEKVRDSSKNTSGFFKYVFNFDEDNKANVFNMLQYGLLSIIPIMVLLNLIKEFIPDVDEKKSTIEILAECIGQVFAIFMGIWFIHKIINFIPTYSGRSYSIFNETTFVLAVLIALFTMQTRLGEKCHILYDRVFDLWDGKKASRNAVKGGNIVKISQPLSQSAPIQQNMQSPLMGLLPSAPQSAMAPDLIKNFNGMYEQPQAQAPAQAQAAPSVDGMLMGPSEPLAANEACGGLFGGTLF
jgi:hypothetical protein